jgi:hypothetical protein
MKPRLVPRLEVTDEEMAPWQFIMRKRSTEYRNGFAMNYRDAEVIDYAIMCKAGHWRLDGVTEPLVFTGALLPWPYEMLPINCGGAVGVYL